MSLEARAAYAPYGKALLAEFRGTIMAGAVRAVRRASPYVWRTYYILPFQAARQRR
jgi:hypothetical protein